MSDIVEKVARAIAKEREGTDIAWECFEYAARAAVAVVLEEAAKVADSSNKHVEPAQAFKTRDNIAAAIRGAQEPRAGITARHMKRGTTYDVLGEAAIQTDAPLSDMAPVVVYKCHQTGALWARRKEEFYDGRFDITQEPRAGEKEAGE